VRVVIQWAVRLACVLLLGHLSMGQAAVSLPFKRVPAFIPLEPLPLAPAEQQWFTALGH